jgi:hypothetical protein
VKRSGHVALLLMGTLAVGGGASALMPRETCEPATPGMAASALPQTNTACSPRSSSGGSGGGHSSRSSFYGGSSGQSSSTATSDSSSGTVTRGGFGSFAHAFGFSGRS